MSAAIARRSTAVGLLAIVAACSGSDSTTTTERVATTPPPEAQTTEVADDAATTPDTLDAQRASTTAPTSTALPVDVTAIPASIAFEPTWLDQIGSPAADSGFTVDVAGPDLVITAFSTQGEIATPSNGERDVVLAAFSLDGEPRWTAQFGTEANDSPLGLSATNDAIYVGGFTEGDLAGPNQGSADVWLARFDLDGRQVWTRQFGGDQWDRGFDVTAHEDGAYISGYTASVLDADTDEGGFDGYAAKFDGDGEMLWTRQFGTDETDWGQGSALAPDGGLYVTGYTEGDFGGPNLGLKDAFVLRLSPDGDEVWVRQFGSDQIDWLQGVGPTPDGGVAVAGSTEGSVAALAQGERDVLIAAFDQNGVERFVTQFGTAGLDSVYEIRAVGDRFVAHGTVTGDIGNVSGERDMMLATLAASGEVVETIQYGSPKNDDGTGLAVAPDGTIVLVGYTSGDVGGPSSGDADVIVGTLAS